MVFGGIMFVWFLLLGSVLSADEFQEIVSNGVGENSQNGDKSNIVPSNIISPDLKSRYSQSSSMDDWFELVNRNSDNNYFKTFNKHIKKGATKKHLTFSIYDDNMREAAIALFRLFQNTDQETFEKVQKWAEKNVNREMYMYALRLESLYSSKTNDNTLSPPFVWNPHYFVNGETIAQASLAFDEVVNKNNNPLGLKKDMITINSNYSGWNLRNNGKEDLLNYFREDVSLNSYYMGLHFLHPFWMSNDELEYLNPRFAEHYYYAHQQLMARYNLEKLHIKAKNSSYSFDNWDYTPYLRYRNGLSFPKRSCVLGDWSEEEAYLKTVDIAIRECISRGLIIMKNGETVTMTDDSHINTLAKLIRANLDGVKFAKIARSVVGYGANSYPVNEYNPSPSILHHPETSLRDPAYWFMIQHMLNYFTEYKNTMKPFDMSQYEYKEFKMIEINVTRQTTYLDYYSFPINNAMSDGIKSEEDWKVFIEARQRRLQCIPFTVKIKVESKIEKNAIVRLYMGPECISDCWNHYNDFFELDTFSYHLSEGTNVISWNLEATDKFSFDGYFNKTKYYTSANPEPIPPPTSKPPARFSLFRFPGNLVLPRGLKEGLRLTMFFIITPADDEEISETPIYYKEVSTELDSKPLGFPFHRQAKGFKHMAINYGFFNISVYHEPQIFINSRWFSPHLY